MRTSANFLKVLLLAVVAVTFTATLNAQQLKFGHVNVQKLVGEMPEKIKADSDLKVKSDQLQQNLKIMSDELDTKYANYMAQRDTMPDLIRATREKELQEIQQRLQTFQMQASQDLQKQEQDLLQPIIAKVQKAIDEVGAENNFIYIFDLSSRVIIYHSDQSIDVEDLVKAKLASM